MIMLILNILYIIGVYETGMRSIMAIRCFQFLLKSAPCCLHLVIRTREDITCILEIGRAHV